jgi:N-acetylglucosamine kinase-like BadF-type ATPase
MSAVLGVEGGGSHTHAIVAGLSGELLGVGASRDPSNWEDVGIEAAGSAIKSCVRAALATGAIQGGDVTASVFALAGVDFPIDEMRLSGIPEAVGLGGPSRILNDAFASLRAGTSGSFGVAVVAGTGSVVAGRNPNGDEFRTLGLGPLFGDSGSASEVSDAAVSAVAGEYLGRGPSTSLTSRMCEAAGVASVVDFLELAGRGRIDSSRFAPLVVAAAQGGDAVARSILRRAGDTLGATATHVVRKLGMTRLEFDLVLAGGLFRSGSRDLIDVVVATVRRAAPGARHIPLVDPPVVGAALLAMEFAGSSPGPAEHAALAESAASALGLPSG